MNEEQLDALEDLEGHIEDVQMMLGRLAPEPEQSRAGLGADDWEQLRRELDDLHTGLCRIAMAFDPPDMIEE